MAWCGVCDIVCMVCCVWYGVGCEVWYRYEESMSCVGCEEPIVFFCVCVCGAKEPHLARLLEDRSPRFNFWHCIVPQILVRRVQREGVPQRL